MSKKLTYQYQIIIAVVIFILIVGISVMLFSQMNQNNATQKQASPAAQTRVSKQATQAYPTFSPEQTNTYSVDTYQIAFPKEWTPDNALTAQTQGNMLSLSPDNSNPDENAHIAVEISSIQQTSVANISAGLLLLGLTRSETVIAGIQAQKFTGIVTLSQKVLHNTIYLFSLDDKIYLIKLSYQGNNTDSKLEEAFVQSVQTFKFK